MAGLVGFNPTIVQGNLNRVLPHIVVPGTPALNVTAPYMAKAQIKLSFTDRFVAQIPTATGIVNSPETMVLATIDFSLLRSQSLANLWLQQTQTNSTIGQVTVYSDSTVFDEVAISDCSIVNFDPGPYDGSDPAVKVTLSGTFYVNSALWASLTGSAGLLTTLV